MCGRFTQRKPAKALEGHFGVEVPETRPSFNIAPTQNVLAIRGGDAGRDAAWLKWGLVPAWAKDASVGARLINARSETVAEKPSFREAFKKRRCLIPADGFYEWQRTGGRKQPYFFRMKDDRPFGFAGLWERWEGEDGRVLDSCTILTTEANEVLLPVHDRMPVILHPEEYALWLEAGERERALLKELLRPYPADEMVSYPVSALVNSPGNRGAELIAEAPLNSA
ncbi:MAG TPA: SOS response-associated peptidase [Pyrinomonadaceae bacterium]|jgi:putative SOS response-associated peptidase YedK